MRAGVGTNYKNEEVKDYLDITRDILQQIARNKQSLQDLLIKNNETTDRDTTKQINRNIRLIDSINELVTPELSFRYLYDINPPASKDLIINEATIGKTQCLAEVGIFILTNESFSERFRVELIKHTNITGLLSDQTTENLFVNESKICLYLKEYFTNYRSIDSHHVPCAEAELLMYMYNIHVNITEYIKSSLTKKLLFEKDLSLFEHSAEKFRRLINSEEINERLEDLKRIKKDVEDFFPHKCFLF